MLFQIDEKNRRTVEATLAEKQLQEQVQLL
jgi:hypothetical protein